MKESQEVYKFFEGKKVLIITNSGFTYNTDCLNLAANGLLFKDKFRKQIFLKFEEVKVVEEVSNA